MDGGLLAIDLLIRTTDATPLEGDLQTNPAHVMIAHLESMAPYSIESTSSFGNEAIHNSIFPITSYSTHDRLYAENNHP